MEALPHFIVVWKDIEEDKIYRTKAPYRQESSIDILFDNPMFSGRKVLYLFRVKTVKYGSVSVPYMQERYGRKQIKMQYLSKQGLP